jgi:hypothetical protein
MLSLRDREHLKSSIADAMRRSVVTRNCQSKFMCTPEAGVRRRALRAAPLSGARQAIIDIIFGVPLSSFTALRDRVARLPGCCVSQSVVIFLNPTIFVSNLIGDNGSLEQPAPSPLQVTMYFDRILERAGRDVS